MTKQSVFNQVTEEHLKMLEQYVPVVSKVHGGSHPEFYEVDKIFDVIGLKIKEAGSSKPDLNEEFISLREVTTDYSVPSDVCESYEAVYIMLAELDKAYHV